MDIAIANAAAAVTLSADQKHFISARIAIGAVAPKTLLLRDAADSLRGKSVSEASISAAANLARNAAAPVDDMRGSIEQRQQIIQVLVSRALRGAIERAHGVPK
jgi:carbon-monoxide dehydrogenase medium subunit